MYTPLVKLAFITGGALLSATLHAQVPRSERTAKPQGYYPTAIFAHIGVAELEDADDKIWTFGLFLDYELARCLRDVSSSSG
jgi:hypothetical protein